MLAHINNMKTFICENCGKLLPTDEALHCEDCHRRYCEDCAKKLALCECSGELSYYN